MGLAEAMVARGYGAISDQEQPLRTQALLVLGLLALLGGWLAYLFGPPLRQAQGTIWRVAAIAGMVVGAGLIGLAIWQNGRGVQHTVYRPRQWTVADTLAVLGCAVTLAVALTQRELLYYSPYPRLSLPAFNPFVGMGLLGLLAPAFVATGKGAGEQGSGGAEEIEISQ
jgi:hypothetical protein